MQDNAPIRVKARLIEPTSFQIMHICQHISGMNAHIAKLILLTATPITGIYVDSVFWEQLWKTLRENFSISFAALVKLVQKKS